MNLTQRRQEFCEIGRRLWQRGFCAGNEGNFSVRVAPQRILCTSTGVSKGFMRPGMPVIVDMTGKQVGGAKKHRPTSEILLHLAIYRKRPDIQAIIHAHTPWATAFACSLRAQRAGALPMGIHPEAEVFLRRVPVVPYCTPGTPEVGRSCSAAMERDTTSVLLGNHGAVCFGETLMQAWATMEMLEAYCRLLMRLKRIGPARRLAADELAALKGNS